MSKFIHTTGLCGDTFFLNLTEIVSFGRATEEDKLYSLPPIVLQRLLLDNVSFIICKSGTRYYVHETPEQILAKIEEATT